MSKPIGMGKHFLDQTGVRASYGRKLATGLSAGLSAGVTYYNYDNEDRSGLGVDAAISLTKAVTPKDRVTAIVSASKCARPSVFPIWKVV